MQSDECKQEIEGNKKATRRLSDRFGIATMARNLLCDSLSVKGVEIVLTRPEQEIVNGI
jgi:hypothetical protein